ncbi:hypothetical protein Hanom_Chr00s115433g01809411 [Helianthus anomalus]
MFLNYFDNCLHEVTILNRQNISATTTQNGIRATDISFAGALQLRQQILETDFDNLIYLNIKLIDNEVRFIKLNNQTTFIENEILSTNTDFDDDYISDEDFNFSHYEWTSSDF